MASVSRVVGLVSLILFSTLAEARIPGVYTGGPWQSAHATFYGGSDASGTMGTIIGSVLILQNLVVFQPWLS